MFLKKWMVKQMVVYLYNEICLKNKKKNEWTIDVGNINESQNNCAEWKKPNEKEYMVYDCTYTKF